MNGKQNQQEKCCAREEKCVMSTIGIKGYLMQCRIADIRLAIFQNHPRFI